MLCLKLQFVYIDSLAVVLINDEQDMGFSHILWHHVGSVSMDRNILTERYLPSRADCGFSQVS